MLFRKRQQVIICIVAGLFLADFVLFGYLPLNSRLKAIKRARSAQNSVIAEAAMQRERLPVITRQLQGLRAIETDFGASVPAQKSIGEFLQQIADLMTQYNLSQQVVAPSKEIKGDGLNCIPINMQCKGRLAQMFEFYKSLQDLDRLTRVERVRLTNDTDLSGEVSMQTMAVIYYRPQSESDKILHRTSEKI